MWVVSQILGLWYGGICHLPSESSSATSLQRQKVIDHIRLSDEEVRFRMGRERSLVKKVLCSSLGFYSLSYIGLTACSPSWGFASCGWRHNNHLRTRWSTMTFGPCHSPMGWKILHYSWHWVLPHGLCENTHIRVLFYLKYTWEYTSRSPGFYFEKCRHPNPDS